MKRTCVRNLLGLVILACVEMPACADEPEIKKDYDVVYKTVGGRELKLDVASPAEGEGPFPAVIAIHGGAWRAGKKEDTRQVIEMFARQGYVAMSPQYRFCPDDKFPAQVHDVKAAVRWLKAHAEEYKLDPERIGVTGFSAGGHLALMLGVTDSDDGLEGDVSEGEPDTRVKAVVNYFGPTDLGAEDIPDVSKPLVKDFLGGTPQEKPEATKQASPVTYVTDDDPPILTFQGTKDPLVPYTQAVKLGEAQTRSGVGGRVELLVGAGHGWGAPDMERTFHETLDFFNRYLKKADAGK